MQRRTINFQAKSHKSNSKYEIKYRYFLLNIHLNTAKYQKKIVNKNNERFKHFPVFLFYIFKKNSCLVTTDSQLLPILKRSSKINNFELVYFN